MLKSNVQDALNGQLHAELASSYLYLSMAAYFESRNLRGMAHWMQIQAQEEWKHAMKFYGFIAERGGRVQLRAVDAPQGEWGSALEAFEGAYKHECKITGLIHGLVKLANSEADFATLAFLQWFVTEQVEEEAQAQFIVEKLKAMGESNVALHILDGELGKRGGS
jgi:ferritin